MSLSKTLNKKMSELLLMLQTNKMTEKEVLEQIKLNVEKPGLKERTMTKNYSLVRTFFKRVLNNEKYKDFLFKIKNDELTDKVLVMDKTTRDERKEIKIDKEVIKKIISFQHSLILEEIVIFVMFVTGRRISEILNVGRRVNMKVLGFDFKEKTEPDKVSFCGILKKKDNEHFECQTIKILITKTKLKKLITKIKLLRGIRKNINIIQKTNVLVKKLHEGFVSHSIRKLYVSYSYKFLNKNSLKFNTFIKEFLNHDSIETSLSYNDYIINFDKPLKI